VYAALFLGRQHLIGVKGLRIAPAAAAAIGARHQAPDLTRQILDLEVLDPICARLARKQTLPRRVAITGERRDQPNACDDDAPHFRSALAGLSPPSPR